MRVRRNTTNQKMSLLRRVGLFLSIPMLVLALIPTTTQAQNANCDKTFYSSNNINFYDPCATSCSGGSGGALTSAAPSSLIGTTNQEKAWNYFAARGLTPVAAAGAMGNIERESSFSAAVEEASGGGGLGIIQWTGDRRDKLVAAASAAGVNLADNDSALLFELNYLWDGEYGAMTWQEPVNAETTVDGNPAIASFWAPFSNNRPETQTGNGSTMVFHALVERSGDVPTEADRIPGHGVLQHRIDTAKGFLEQFGGTSSSGNCEISAGGLNWEQAKQLAQKLVDDWDTIYCGPGAVTTGGNPGGYCNWQSGYCTAGPAFLSAVTAPDPSRVPGIPNGVRVADTFIAENPDVYTSANPDGSNLLPFSIWSFGDGSPSGEPGHTGMIVGIGDDGSIITVETNWGGDTGKTSDRFLYNNGRRSAAFIYPTFEDFKTARESGGDGYFYTATATPKDSSVAAEMSKKMMQWIGN